MGSSKRVRDIAKRGYEILEKEFCRSAFVEMMLEPILDDLWDGMVPPTAEEANEALDVLERSGRILRDVRDIHKDKETDSFEHCCFFVTSLYPNTCADIKRYKHSRDYAKYLARRKYGWKPGEEMERFHDPEVDRKRAEAAEKDKRDRIAFAASHPSHGAMKAAMPEKCPICFADLKRTTCSHTWDEMIERTRWT